MQIFQYQFKEMGRKISIRSDTKCQKEQIFGFIYITSFSVLFFFLFNFIPIFYILEILHLRISHKNECIITLISHGS